MRDPERTEGGETLTIYVPTVATERLLLRAHRAADFDAYAAMWSDPAVVRHIGPPARRDEVWTRFLKSRGHWSTLGYGYWIAEERESGRLVGEIGYADHRRPWEPDAERRLAGLPEAGWVLASWAHGQGFASEAVAAVHAWGETTHGWTRGFCIIAPANAASLRVAEKTGYVEAFRTPLKGETVVVLERLSENLTRRTAASPAS
jgi:RimJ/RimL family protein N-acetyltransferase